MCIYSVVHFNWGRVCWKATHYQCWSVWYWVASWSLMMFVVNEKSCQSLIWVLQSICTSALTFPVLRKRRKAQFHWNSCGMMNPGLRWGCRADWGCGVRMPAPRQPHIAFSNRLQDIQEGWRTHWHSSRITESRWIKPCLLGTREILWLYSITIG